MRDRGQAGVESVAVGENQIDTLAELAGVNAALRGAVAGDEADPCQPGVVEPRGQLPGIDPRRPKPLKRLVGASADRDVGGLEWFGAPWIEARELAARLNDAELTGIRFVPRDRTPNSSVHAGELCHGVDLILTNRDAFDAGLTAITLAKALVDLYGDTWQIDRFPRLWGRPEVTDQLRSEMEPQAIAASWQDDLASFMRIRERYLIYE